ncbi:hypothetical protein [Petrotoga olearia]|uniref:hypothetical protein n=1 Tax=Petrotoga olearia TaxID=156203 RepID=UPI001473D918|nr:hypothetical protein [Petrotoga olearia]
MREGEFGEIARGIEYRVIGYEGKRLLIMHSKMIREVFENMEYIDIKTNEQHFVIRKN